MPKIPIDYSNSVIYKIVCKDLAITDLYVGSTTQFTKRKNTHKSYCKSNKQLKIYNMINANGGWDNWIMVEIEKYKCNDGNELRARERYWCEELQPILNMNSPIFDILKNSEHKKTYYVMNRDIRLEQMKTYHMLNKEHINNRHRTYRAAKKVEKELKEQDLLCSIETDLVLKDIIIL